MPERITLVDKYGRRQTNSIPRHELHIHQKPDLYVEAVIIVVQNSSGYILAHRRAAGKTHEDHYDHVCGALQTFETPETPEEAAFRELYEEYGIPSTAITELVFITSSVNVNRIYRHLFRAVTDAQPKILRPHEVASIECFDSRTLYAMRDSGTAFVDGFFSDLAAAHK